MKSLLILLLLLYSGVLFGQTIAPELSVIREKEMSAKKVLGDIANLKRDTAQIRLMIRAMRIYYNNTTEGMHELDSAFTLAKTAYDLSRKLNFGEGAAEAVFIMGKLRTKQKNPEAAVPFLKLVHGEAKVRLLLVIAEYYTFNFDSKSKDFQKALPLIVQARRVANTVNSFRWVAECEVLSGKYFFINGELEKGKKAFLGVIERYEKAKQFKLAAHIWSRLANNIPENAANVPYIRMCQEHAIKDFLLANDKENMAYTLRDLAVLNADYQQLDSAEKQYLRVLSTLKSIHLPVKFSTLNHISSFYRYAGKYDLALFYALESRKAPDYNDFKKISSAEVVALIYQAMGKRELSLQYFLEAYGGLENLVDRRIYFIALSIAVLRSEMGKKEAGKGLVFLNKFLKNHPPVTATAEQQFAYAYGEIYNTLGQYGNAENAFKKMISLDSKVEEEASKDINSSHNLAGGGAAMAIGRFYVNRKRFLEARPFLQRALKESAYGDVQQIRDTHHLLFRADSAMNDYIPAIKNLQRYNVLNDSINSVARANQFEELNMKYETVQKEKSIKSLENKQRLQEMIIQRSDKIKKLTVGGAILLLLIFIITFVSLKNKQRSNKNLTLQRKEINEKNIVLETLLSEKDNFLKEKDWLLKEVHHRVKNNLQIIISLLDTQSVYLENNIALEAIQESQNRVHSIALIHQKLYRSDKPGSISLPEYVSDLIENLSDGFNALSRNIIFEQNIDRLDIDLSQAVPLGLILNESITNAIKYAFEKAGGRILIEVTAMEDQRVRLVVADNGLGLPKDFDISTINSLGMELMKGLSRQIKGDFHISSDEGVSVTVEFELLKTFTNQALLPQEA